MIHKEFVAGGKAVNIVFYIHVLQRLLTRISREGRFVSYAWLYPSSFCCESETLLTNHGVMQISQPPYLPHLMPADVCLFPKVKTAPHSRIKKGRYQDIDDNKSNITAELRDFFWIPSVTVWGSFQKDVRRMFQWWEMKQFIFCASRVWTAVGHTGAARQ